MVQGAVYCYTLNYQQVTMQKKWCLGILQGRCVTISKGPKYKGIGRLPFLTLSHCLVVPN